MGYKMFKYVYAIILASTITACQQSYAATITLNGTYIDTIGMYAWVPMPGV